MLKTTKSSVENNEQFIILIVAGKSTAFTVITKFAFLLDFKYF